MGLEGTHALGLALLLVVASPGFASSVQGPQDAPSRTSLCVEGFPSQVACPDLVVDERSLWDARIYEQTFDDEACAVEEGLIQPGARRIVRFSFTAANQGPADLVLGDPSERPDLFTYSSCEDHDHHHFDGFAAYRLWTPEGYAQWVMARSLDPLASANEVIQDSPDLEEALVSGHKQGFCIRDTQPVIPFTSPVAPAQYGCHAQGLSVGWGDTYGWHLDGQWVDITGVEDGYYVLEAEVNPERVLAENAYANNAAVTHVYVPPTT